MLDHLQAPANPARAPEANTGAMRLHALQPARPSRGRERTSPSAPAMITQVELRRILGGPQTLPEGFNEGIEGELPLTRLDLEPGDVLYTEGSKAAYAYIVESGLMQCARHVAEVERAASAISYSAARDMLGVQGLPSLHGETATAVTRASLLALPVHDLRDMVRRSALLSELIARPMGQALLRDWRTAYSLRDLPPYARTVAGLSHLVRLAVPQGDAPESGARLAVSIETTALRRWLGLSEQELEKCLAQLARYGALSQHKARIDMLAPDVLLKVSSALRPWRKEALEPAPQAGPTGSLVQALSAAAVMLLATTHAHAAAGASLHPAQAIDQAVPWGFVLFSSLILLLQHMRPSGRRRLR
jgi:CRP-like cAMP-binding protein